VSVSKLHSLDARGVNQTDQVCRKHEFNETAVSVCAVYNQYGLAVCSPFGTSVSHGCPGLVLVITKYLIQQFQPSATLRALQCLLQPMQAPGCFWMLTAIPWSVWGLVQFEVDHRSWHLWSNLSCWTAYFWIAQTGNQINPSLSLRLVPVKNSNCSFQKRETAVYGEVVFYFWYL